MNRKNQLSIGELAEMAGVTVRTIRYYIEQGLLPRPETQGRYTTYDTSYVNRLRLIRELKEQFLPLGEIRKRLRGMDDEEVAGKVDPAPVAESMLADFAQSGFFRMQLPRLADTRKPPKVAPKPRPEESNWDRIELFEGVELHIRQPDRHPALIRALLELARNFETRD